MKKTLSLIALILCFAASASFAHVDMVFYSDAGMVDARIDSILPTRVELPSALSKLEKPTNRLNPLYGHIMEYRSKYYSANTVVGKECRYRDEYNRCVSVPRVEEFLPADELESSDAGRFLKDRAEKIMQRNDSLLEKAKPHVRQEYLYLAQRAQVVGLHDIKIYVDYFYDSTEKKWVRSSAENCIVSMMMISKSGYFLHQDDDSTISIRKYSLHVPAAQTKRLFFDNGYSRVVSGNPENLPFDSIKVIPYKLVIQVPHNKNVDYRQKMKKALEKRDYDAVRAILKKMEHYSAKDMFTRPALDLRTMDMLAILLQDYSDTNWTIYVIQDVELYDDRLEELVETVFNEYVQSGAFENALSKEKDLVKRAVARITANRVRDDSDGTVGEKQRNIVLAYLDSIPDRQQGEFLVQKYWNQLEMHPFYIYFSEMGTVNRYVGRLGKRIRPGFGFGGAFGGGNTVMSVDIFVQGFFWSSFEKKASSSKCFKNRNMKDYEFDALDIGMDVTYKWLVTRRFEGGIYAGPTFNMSEVVKEKWDKDAPRNENEPSLEVAPGLDVGLSFALFEAFNRRDVERMSEATMYKGGRLGGRLRIGMSTQKAMESFDVWGWKAYMTLEVTLRAHIATRKMPFLWR